MNFPLRILLLSCIGFVMMHAFERLGLRPFLSWAVTAVLIIGVAVLAAVVT